MNKPEERTDWVNIKSRLEMEPIIGKWIQFNRLDTQTQQRVWDEWNEYYKACKTSSMGELARNIADAIRDNDLPKLDALKQLHKDLKAMKSEVAKPKTSMDPMEFYHNEQVYMYKKALNEIERGRNRVSF